MKIRTGFISNSSSSSFIVAFPHKPTSVQDVKEMLFGKQEWHYKGYSYGDESSDVPTQGLAESVFNSITKKATKQEILDSIQHGWFDSYMYPDMFPGYYSDSEKTAKLNYQDKDERKEIDRIWKETEKINEDRARNIAEAFSRANNDKYIVVMRFSDNDGEAIEEHSGIFNRVEHIGTSYH